MIRPYSEAEDFPVMQKWLELRDRPGLSPDMLPKIGLVVEGEAIAFLVGTDTQVAWIAHWCVNPRSSQDGRNLAIATIFREIEKMAVLRGYKILQSCGLSENMKARFWAAGYKAFGDYTFFAKNLEG